MSRLKTLFWFSLMLFFLWRLLLPADVNDSSLTRPTTADTRSSGLAGLTGWLERSNIDVHSQRLRLSELPPRVAGSSGHLAIVHLPALLVYEAEEVKALLHWVELGNTLLVAAGYLEGSDWIYDANSVDMHRSFWRLTGLDADFASSDTRGDTDSGVDQGLGDSSEGDSLEDVLEDVAEDLSESVNDALELPGWLQVHGATEAVTLEPAVIDPLVNGLDDLQAPWDEMRWDVVLPVEQAIRLELTDAREIAEAAQKEQEAQTEKNLEQESEQESEQEENQPEDDVEGDAVASASADDNSRSRYYPSWRSDLEACGNDADASVRQLAGRTGCIDVPTPKGEDWLTLLRHKDSEQIVLLGAPLKQGELLVLWQPALLDNEVIHLHGNRDFVSQLIETKLATNGVVVVDDAHQGLNRIVEAEDLLSDSRLYITIGFLLLFWVAYLLADSGQWERATWREPVRRIGQRALIAANANFLSKRLRLPATHEMQLLPLQAHLARKWRVSRKDALKTGLERERSTNGDAAEALSRSLARLSAGKGVSPLDLQNQIDRLLHPATTVHDS